MATKLTNKKSGRFYVRIISAVALALVVIVNLFTVGRIVDIYRAELFESFKYENRTAVETMVGNVNQVYEEFERGELSEDQARQLAVLMVQNGVWNDGKRGFWALESDGTLVAKVENGDVSEKPGESVWDFQDVNGKYFERDIIEAGHTGGDFVEFTIQNESVNNTYVAYALATDFGFVVDATFDMNYFNQHWNGSITSAWITYFVAFLIGLGIVLVLLAGVWKNKKV